MGNPRVFIPSEQVRDNVIHILGSDVHYIRDVLRLKPNDPLEVLDDKKRVYATTIQKIDQDKISCTLVEMRNLKSEPGIQVTIAQGIPKGHKLDQVVRQGTEIGMHGLIPMFTERSIPKWSKEKSLDKQNRWQRIAKEAAEQSGRLMIPTITPPLPFADVIIKSKDYSATLFLSESEDDLTLKAAMQRSGKMDSLLLIIGPEGGFSSGETNTARSMGISTISIGRRILRTETAPIAALAMIFYEIEL